MKKRVFNILNFVALNVLFFAIYLNFIHKDVNVLPAPSPVAVKNFAQASSATQVASVPQKQKLHTNED